MSEYKKQHILPQFYLKGFGFINSNDKKLHNIYVGDIKANIVKEKSINNIGYLNDIFTNYFNDGRVSKQIEIDFGIMEGKLKPIIDHINNNALKAHGGIFNKLELEIEETTQILKLLKFLLKKITLARILDRKIDLSTLEQSDINNNKEEIFNLLYDDHEEGIDIMKEIAKRNWKIIYTDKEEYNFLSSDFPIFWGGSNTGSMSLYEHDAPICFALTKNIFLYFYGKSENDFKNLEYIYQDDYEKIKLLNISIISNANDYIFGYNKNQVQEALDMIKSGKTYKRNSV